MKSWKDKLKSFPSSWYFIASSNEITRNSIFRLEIFENSLVFFRNNKNVVVALDSRCSHLGADLGNGFLDKDNLVCPLHHWKYNSLGKCTYTTASNVEHFSQKTFPVVEEFGSVFVFLGDEFFSFPEFVFKKDFVYEALPEVTLNTTWETLGANGYDTLHLSVVHKRGLLEKPICSFPEKHIFKMQTKAFVEGNEFFDKVIKFLSKNKISAEITSFGGVFITLESTLNKKKSLLLVFLRPENKNVKVYAIAGIRKKNKFLDYFRKKISSFLFQNFLFKDIIPLQNMKLRRENLALDPVLKLYDEYLKNLGF